MSKMRLIKGTTKRVLKIASNKDIDKYLRAPEEPELYTLVLDDEKNIVVELYVKKATVIEAQRCMESFIAMGKKGKSKRRGDEESVQFKIVSYYKDAWKRWVVRTNPKMRYKDVKYYLHDFNAVLNQIFPSPFELFNEGELGIDDEEEKNSDPLSEEERD